MRLVMRLPACWVASNSRKCLPVLTRALNTTPGGVPAPCFSAMAWSPRGVPRESFTLEGGRSEVEMTWLFRKAQSWKNIRSCCAMVTAMTRGVGLIPSTAHLCFIRSNISFTVSNNSYRVGIVGATGAVGQELIALLQAHAFPLAELRPLASARSAGKGIDFGGKKITVQEATPAAFAGLNVCFFAAGGSVTKALAPEAVKRGCL